MTHEEWFMDLMDSLVSSGRGGLMLWFLPFAAVLHCGQDGTGSAEMLSIAEEPDEAKGSEWCDPGTLNEYNIIQLFRGIFYTLPTSKFCDCNCIDIA